MHKIILLTLFFCSLVARVHAQDEIWDTIDGIEDEAETAEQSGDWDTSANLFKDILDNNEFKNALDPGNFEYFTRRMSDAYGRAGLRQKRYNETRDAAFEFEQRYGLDDVSAINVLRAMRNYAEDYCEYDASLNASQKIINAAEEIYGQNSFSAFVAMGEEWDWRSRRQHQKSRTNARFKAYRKLANASGNEIISLYGDYYWARHLYNQHGAFPNKQKLAEANELLANMLALPNNYAPTSNEYKRLNRLKMSALTTLISLGEFKDSHLTLIDISEADSGVFTIAGKSADLKKETNVTALEALTIYNTAHRQTQPFFKSAVRYSKRARIDGVEGHIVANIDVLPNGFVDKIEIASANGTPRFAREAAESVAYWIFPPGYAAGSLQARRIEEAELQLPPLEVCIHIDGRRTTGFPTQKRWVPTGTPLKEIRKFEERYKK